MSVIRHIVKTHRERLSRSNNSVINSDPGTLILLYLELRYFCKALVVRVKNRQLSLLCIVGDQIDQMDLFATVHGV